MAEEPGFAVLEAVDAEEAIWLLQLHSDIRVVLTDIGMPGAMDGLDCQAVRHRLPSIQVSLKK